MSDLIKREPQQPKQITYVGQDFMGNQGGVRYIHKDGRSSLEIQVRDSVGNEGKFKVDW